MDPADGAFSIEELNEVTHIAYAVPFELLQEYL